MDRRKTAKIACYLGFLLILIAFLFLFLPLVMP
jgi:hypothetical protein